ncbi:recombinase family protein [Streptomyces scopuliridis]|uniref:recombinase family protein n=1 Tax=Streptomyces scopuliridis TaxID=452529 RepID=UPI0036D01C93
MPISPEFLHLVYPGLFTAYLYGRASRDPKKKGRSVGDQMKELHALCAKHNWQVAGVFADIDRSATRFRKQERDDFEEMLAGIKAGKCRIVVAWEASRYYRDIEVYIRLRNACAEASVLFCYNGVVYDLSKREDRRATAQDALQAEDEGEGIRDRNLRTVRLNAESGRPHGSLLEGYKRRYDPETGDLIDQYEHPVGGPYVTEAFRRAAAAEPLRSIYTDFNRRGHLTQHGKEWKDWNLRVLLRNPGYLARRIFQGEDVGEASWPPLTDQETFDSVQAILDDPARNTLPEEGTMIRHLLTNIALCGLHPEQDIEGNPAVTDHPETDPAKRREPPVRFTQNRGKAYITCGQSYDTTIRETMLDAYVEQGVLRWLSSPAAAKAFEKTDDDTAARAARARAAAMEQQLEEAREASTRFKDDGTPELSIVSLTGIEARLTPLIKAARAAGKSTFIPEIVQDIVGNPDAEAMWAALTMAQRRFVVRHVVTVRIFKARTKGVRTIEPGRVTLSYFGQPGFRPTPVNQTKANAIKS